MNNKNIIFDKVNNFINGYACVCIDNLHGVINTNGEFVIKPKYHFLENINGKYFIAKNTNDNKFGVIDIDDNVIIPLVNNNIEAFSEEDTYFIVTRDNLICVMNSKQEEIITNGKYEFITYCGSEPTYLMAKKDKFYGVIDISENIYIPFEYSSIEFYDYKFIAGKDNTYGVLDNNNNLIEPFTADKETLYFKLNQIQYNNSKQTEIIPNFDTNKYRYVGEFSKIKGKPFDSIAKVSNFDIQSIYDNWNPLEQSYEEHKKEFYCKFGLVDNNGNLIIPCLYDGETPTWYFNNLICISKNGKYGFIDWNNNIVVEFIYDEILLLNDNDEFLIVKKDEKYGFVDRQGNLLNIKS